MNARENVKAFVDGELTEIEIAEFEKERKSNPELDDLIHSTRVATAGLKLVIAEPAVTGKDALKQKLTARSKPKAKIMGSPWLWLSSSALAVLLISSALRSTSEMSANSGPTASAAPAMRSSAERAPATARAYPAVRKGASGAADTSLGSDGREHFDAAPVSAAKHEDLQINPGPTVDNRPKYTNTEASLTLESANVDKAVSDAEEIISEKKGYVVNLDEAEHSATLHAKVPFDQVGVALGEIKRIGKVLAYHVSNDDVTDQVLSAQGEISNDQKEELAIYAELRRTESAKRRIQLLDRLHELQNRLQDTKTQNGQVKRATEMSQIQVQFSEPAVPAKVENKEPSAGERLSTELGKVGSTLVDLLISLIATAPFWIPLGLLAWWLAKKASKF